MNIVYSGLGSIEGSKEKPVRKWEEEIHIQLNIIKLITWEYYHS